MICVWLAGGIGLFLFSLALHVIVWRVRRPQSYHGWLPILAMILGFTLLFAALLMTRLRAEVLNRERTATWIREVVSA